MMRAIRFILGTDARAADTSSRAAIIRFVLISVLLYTLFCWLQPTLLPAYRTWYRTFGNAVFSGSKGVVGFFNLHHHDPRSEVEGCMDRLIREVLPPHQHPAQPIRLPPRFAIPKEEGEKDTLLLLQNREKPGSVGFLRSGSRLMGYAPTALLLSLVAATPVGWLRRMALLLAGLVLLHIFIAFRLWVFVLQGGFADSTKDYSLYSPGEFWAKTLWRADKVLVEDPTFNYVIPVVIWLATVIALSLGTSWRQRRASSSV